MHEYPPPRDYSGLLLRGLAHSFRPLAARPARCAVVAQLVRAPDCGSGGRWFKPTQLYHSKSSEIQSTMRKLPQQSGLATFANCCRANPGFSLWSPVVPLRLGATRAPRISRFVLCGITRRSPPHARDRDQHPGQAIGGHRYPASSSKWHDLSVSEGASASRPARSASWHRHDAACGG